jgi:hypothetical protein
VVRIRDAAADREAQAGAVRLGGHERIEDGAQQGLGDTRAGIRHLHDQRLSPTFRQIDHAHGQFPARFHRLDGI